MPRSEGWWPWVRRSVVREAMDALERNYRVTEDALSRRTAELEDERHRLIAQVTRLEAAQAMWEESATRGDAVVAYWKERAEQADARYDGLCAKYVEAVTPKPPDPKKPAPPPKSDEDMVREAEAAFVARAKRAETEFVTRLTDDLVRQGFPRSDAEKEARRLRAESTSTTLQPGA